MRKSKNILRFAGMSEKEIEEIADQIKSIPVGQDVITNDITITNEPTSLWYCETRRDEEE